MAIKLIAKHLVLLLEWTKNFPIVKDMARAEDWMNLVYTNEDLEKN